MNLKQIEKSRKNLTQTEKNTKNSHIFGSSFGAQVGFISPNLKGEKKQCHEILGKYFLLKVFYLGSF